MAWTRRHFLAAGGAVAATSCSPPAVLPAQDADVIILGAGLSGLHAARMLAGEGARLIVLEARERTGGRMWTLDDVPGRPEAGGQQVGQTYARIRATAADLGLDIVPPPPGGSRDRAMLLGDDLFDARDWAASPHNPFPEAFKPATPDAALFMAAARANPLTDQYAWREAGAEYDISAGDFLSAQGFDAEARALCNVALNANRLDTYSMLNLWRTLVLYEMDRATGPSEEIAGGSQRLPEAMAASLPEGTLRLASPVRAIAADETGVTVSLDGETLRAPFVICSLPFPALARLALDAPLTPAHREAVATMPYTQIHQVHLALENRYWEADGLPAMMWTDTPLERVFPVRDATGDIVALTCWINGDGIRPGLSDADYGTLAEATLAEWRGARTRAMSVIRWDREQPLSGGAYMHWAPGQIGRLAEPIFAPAGRLHFAGEHLSYLHTGMEGAMEAGERAGYALIEAMSEPAG